MEYGLSYDDVLLVPRYADALPHEIDTSIELADGIKLRIPIISAAMDTVTESHMATVLALNGGVGVIHRNLSMEAQAREVSQVKESLSWIIHKPITVSSDQLIRVALTIMEERSIGGLPVVDEGIVKGIVTKKDLIFSNKPDTHIKSIMIQPPVVFQGNTPSHDEIMGLFNEFRVKRIPLVDKKNKLLGLVCLNDVVKKQIYNYENAAIDDKNKLLVGAAVSPHMVLERTQTLIDSGVNFIVVDTAHGDSLHVIEAIKKLRSTFPSLVIVGGNVATAESTLHLINAGADIIKVGMGPGSICTTRIVSGMGVPQFTAVKNCVAVAEKHGKCVVADGGIRFSGDITKAIGIGAASVMLGRMLAGFKESPGTFFNQGGGLYKMYRGMGSVSAISQGSGDRYQFSVGEQIVPEGIESKLSYRGKLAPFLNQIIVGLKKGMGYCGCRNISELMKYRQFLRITHAGIVEGNVHDVTEII